MVPDRVGTYLQMVPVQETDGDDTVSHGITVLSLAHAQFDTAVGCPGGAKGRSERHSITDVRLRAVRD